MKVLGFVFDTDSKKGKDFQFLLRGLAQNLLYFMTFIVHKRTSFCEFCVKQEIIRRKKFPFPFSARLS